MSKKKTSEEFVLQVKEKFPYIDVVDEYKTAREKIRFHCRIHDHDFLRTPDDILRSSTGCPKCGRDKTNKLMLAKRTTPQEFANRFYAIRSDIELLEDYKTLRDKILVRCKVCGNEWSAYPDKLLQGWGCKKCAMVALHNKMRKTHDEFMLRVRQYNPHHDKFEVISQFTGADDKVSCKCLICGRTWDARASHLSSIKKASGCPYCNLSKGETAIRKFLEDNKIEFEAQKPFDGLLGLCGGNLRYDFFVPNENLLIEFQGEFHDGSVVYQTPEQLRYRQIHDDRKRKYAKTHGIELMEIWYPDRDHIPEILSTRLFA